MLITTELIKDSVVRLKLSRAEVEKLAATVSKPDRSRRASDTTRMHRLRTLLNRVEDPIVANIQLERVLGGNDLVGVNFLSIGAKRARSVCRIHLRDSSGSTVGFGTGFLIGPGVLMTNHHVLAGADEARNSLAEFDYEYDDRGKDMPVAAFQLLVDPTPIAHEELDFCLVGVASRSVDGTRGLEEFGWLPLNATPGKAIIGEYLTIIQHPGGERKQTCVRENQLLKYDDNGSTLWYHTDTVGGSSGSPVFNGTWEVVALHHSGVPEKDAQGRWLTVDGKPWDSSMDESRIKWIANEGIRISSISEYVRTRRADEPLAQAIVHPQPSPLEPERSIGASNGNGAGLGFTVRGNVIHVTTPIRFAIGLDAGSLAYPVSGNGSTAIEPHGAPATSLPIGANGAPSGIESVSVNQSNYKERQGYQQDFLGEGDLEVPLPTVTKVSQKKQILKVDGQAGGGLNYWNYTVLMNKARKLAFYSAVNVDAERRPTGAGRDGDRWFIDTRIESKFQLGAEFYGRQKEFEADRSQNPFDRGHLTRRLDAQWGTTSAQAKRNGDDSFHWTNCAPQHYRFNQGAKLWLGLEDWVIDSFAGDGGRRACVINGPVFDAPLSVVDNGGRLVPNLKGKAHKDPVFGDSEVAIPKLYFKVVACRDAEGSLAAAGFLMSQEALLRGLDRIKGMPPISEEKLTNAEARLYQVSIEDLSRLVDLDFGPLTSHEVSIEEVAADGLLRPIARFEDIRL